jgi:hypothetical protein
MRVFYGTTEVLLNCDPTGTTTGAPVLVNGIVNDMWMYSCDESQVYVGMTDNLR